MHSFSISDRHIQLQVPLPPSERVIHALQLVYLAVHAVLSFFLQTKKQGKSESLHVNSSYIYSESAALVLLNRHVKS